MAERRSLRVVKPDEAPAKSLTVAEAAAAGDIRAMLVAMRAEVALRVGDKATPARDLAALTKRLLEISREIEAQDAREAEEAHERAATPDEPFDAAAI